MCVGLYWSLSLISKLVQSGLPGYNFTFDPGDPDEQSQDQKHSLDHLTVWDATLIFLIAIAFDIAPYYLIIQVKFIKIFTFDHVLGE